MPPAAHDSRQRQLPLAASRAMAGVLAAFISGYGALVVATYLHLTPPSSLYPDAQELGQLLLAPAQPVSRIERLLAASTGEMSGGGTMRPAFTDRSTGWDELTSSMTAEDLARLAAEREGERLALLDWVRSGADRAAYDQDSHQLTHRTQFQPITQRYLDDSNGASGLQNLPRVRIRSLIAERCVTCHGEDGRDDTARFIPLDSYERLATRLKPEGGDGDRRSWLSATLLGLFPLAGIVIPLFWFNSRSWPLRKSSLLVTVVALALVAVCWLSGPPAAVALFAAAAVGAAGIVTLAAVTIQKLLSSARA